MRARRDDPGDPDPGREAAFDRPRDDADLIDDIGDIRRAASRLGDLGIAEFADLAAALAAIERDLAASDPHHPDGRRLRADLETRLDDLGTALRTLLDLIDRMRHRPV